MAVYIMMEITRERLSEIANLSDKVLSDGRVISPDAYQSVKSIEITTMAKMLLGYLKKENKNQMDSNVNIYDVLDGWGAWAAAGNSYVDWQPVADKYKNVVRHGKKSRRQCDSYEGRMIDESVFRLKKLVPEDYELVIAHFVIGISLRTIAKRHECSDGSIRKKLYAAMGFVSGCLL